METDSVRLFVLAAEKGNITAAGRALGMVASAASTKLAKLERTLGADLLHRSTRKVALSLEGSEFLPYAREILAQEDAALAAMGRSDTTVTG
ncbi:MAG: LysR family transcriptional regulator, partial [Pseudomonadota bacterium]